MPWAPLPTLAFAICVHPFRATESEDLPLEVGDHIYIIEQGGGHGDWYRGYLVAPPSLLAGLTSDRGQQLEHRVFSGIFPRNCVEIRELMGDNKDSGSGTQPGSPVGQGDGTEVEQALERRKSQKAHARRLSRALNRKRSQRSMKGRSTPRAPTVHDPMPRDPNAPKPIAPVPLLRVGDETGVSAEEPLVDEIASCLREWHDARLHELLLSGKYSRLGKLADLIKRVDDRRKQLLHDVMTVKELGTLREDVVWDLVAGNKMLSDEVVVRSAQEKGRILTADDSVIEMTKLQANMSILDRPPQAPVDLNMLYHVYVDVRNLVIDSQTPATLQMFICSKEPGNKPRALTENFSITTPSDYDHKSPADAHKSFFINLSATDVGFGSETTSVYVVFKLLRDEPVRQATPAASLTPPQANGAAETASDSPQARTSLRTRRSVFGSQRRKQSLDRQSERPNTAQSQVSEATHTSATESAPVENRTVKRIVAMAAVELGSIIRQSGREMHQKVLMWTPSIGAEAPTTQGEGWEEVVRELLRSPTGGFAKVPIVKRFELFATAFATHDLDALIRSTPTLLQDVHSTRKIGFSGAPTEKRSDIYLTLTEPIIPGRNAVLSHSKYGSVPISSRTQTSLANLQLTLEVRRADGERLEECIFTSSNNAGHTAWRTTAVERGEGWNQIIRLAIPPEDVQAFVRDGDHQVALYVYDEYSSSMINGKGAYLALPPWHKKHDAGQANAAHLSVSTYLCSTEYSQDPNLLGLLNWRQYHGARLTELLERFALVPDIEIVKLLPDVFNKLFQILDEYTGNDVYEGLVFSCFVTVFSITRDRRFGLTDVIEQFATTRHRWQNASGSLIRAYQQLVSSPLDPDSSRRLRAALKVGDQMLKLIIETRKHVLSNGTEVNGFKDDERPMFIEDLQRLFITLMALMRNPLPVLLGTQTLVIQHFHSWLPELASIMTPIEVLEIATDLMDACAHAQGKLILHRLVLLINYSRLGIFKHAEVRQPLVANTYRWLAPYWGAAVPSEQWRNQVRLCCSVVATQMAELGEETCQYVPKLVESYEIIQKLERPSKRTFSMLFPVTYPFVEKKTPDAISVDESLLEISALLSAALTTKTGLYFDASVVDIPGVLMQALNCVRSILACEAFPSSWLSLHVSHHKFATLALSRIEEVLVSSLPDIYAPDASEAFEFDTPLWRAYFGCLFAAVSSSALAMESFPEQKRRAIWKIAGDVREFGAKLLKHSWEAIGWEMDDEHRKLHGFDRMGGYQVQFVPELVAPIVELCLSMHASLRAVATEVLRSMIVSSWEIDQDLDIIQTAMIDCLDKLCRSKAVSEAVLQKSFINEMLTRFEPIKATSEDDLYRAVVAMFTRIEELLGLLGIVHAGGALNEATRIMDTLRLMEFLRGVQSNDAYIRYVHQLADLQAKAGNHTEAGLALKLHADQYSWDHATAVEAMSDPNLPAQKVYERKEALYLEILQQFERGQAWHEALAIYKELSNHYETNVFDYHKLARTQRAMAGIHERISKGERYNPRYFRVVYRGLGFPLSLRDKQFIFQGQPDDRLARFEDRMQQLHPAAKILRIGAEPDMEGQYLQIYAVSTHRDLGHTIYQRVKVSQNVRDHCLLSNPDKFSTTSRQPMQDVPVIDQTVEKVIYTTAQTFPTILRRVEIIETEAITLSPIEAAVERTTRKTQELVTLEKRVSSGEDSAMDQLSEALLLSVDPNSDSSVSRYRVLLPSTVQTDTASAEVDPEALDLNAEEPSLDPMQQALKVSLLDHALVIRRCLSLYNKTAWLATRAELIPRFEASFAAELEELYPGQAGNFDLTVVPSNNDIDRESQNGQQASEGADQNGAETTTPSDDKRRGRRRSLSFLKRGSSKSSLRGNKDEGGQERDSSRARSSIFHGDSYHYHDRKPFPPRSSISKDGQMNGAREWHGVQQGIPPPAPLSASSNIPPPNFFVAPQPPASNVVHSAMPLPYDPSRRRSIGAAASPPQFAAGPAESPSMPSFAPRSMMPPSPSQPLPSAAHGAHGPPTTSPFAGIRDLASLNSGRRSGAGMSISSILGGAVDEPKSTQKSMQPPSPGRARASSMREYSNGYRERSPLRRDQGIFGQRSADGSATSEQPAHSFRAFPPQNGYGANGNLPGRPSSQPSEQRPLNLVSETSNRSDEGQINMFRSFASTADSYGKERPGETIPATQHIDRSAFSSPGAIKELRDVFSPAYPSKQFATPMREDQAPLFRPAYPQPMMSAHEPVEAIRGETERATPQPYPLYRNGYFERPLTYEEHQRLEGARELQRKDSDPRSIFNISPELRRRGRDSPLPQAVHGAQPRHIGPGGDHPSIKSEFGRMFSGLGGGFGSATPVAGQSMNGNGTPSRIVSPTRPGEAVDYGRSFDDEGPRSASVRPSRKSGGRRSREDEIERYDGRMTPSLSQRGNKRAKTGHPHHHHHHHHNTVHHHHHDGPEQPGYGMIRFPSTPLVSTLKHHHHHSTHAHPTHHHHHQLAHSSMPPLRKPEITVRSDAVVEAVAKKPRKHLGSMPYNVHTSDPAINGPHLHYSTSPELIPKFEGKENCTYTVRVPRWYITRTAAEIKAGELSRLEEICRERRVWGSDIYTDDSDVIAAAVHSGWIRGDFGYSNDDISALDEETQHEPANLSLSTKPAQPLDIPAGYDMHVTLLILPPLEEYASTHRHHIWSRDWKGAELHDGMSYMIFKLDFVDEGAANRGVSRDASNRKARIAVEERKRREAAAALLMLPGI
ncbi:hypothetical protein AMS68_003462 [Peltaster fructicola]|uniref:Dedicator of cytokinesis protein 1 n=1 Tax=Peltaster fructicola TaxID=286661 RepID=A0A6H0XTH3_9PEZI|nr:hypothetical protein AMS68_003462 [Peltaster fructicola]